MAETASPVESVPERAVAQPANEVVQNFAPAEKATEKSATWSDVANQCWNGDIKEGTSALAKALRESLGLGNQEASKDLENSGILPRTRIHDNNSDTTRPVFSVQWGNTPLSRIPQDRQVEGEQNTRPRLELVRQPGGQGLPASGRMAKGPQTEGSETTEVPGRGARNRGGAPAAGERDRTAEGDRTVVSSATDSEAGRVYEFKLDRNTGRHNVDAAVIVPRGYDPEKPTRMLIYNHGFRTSAHGALSYSQLTEQMKAADPQTILVVPEWQARPGSESSARGKSDEQGFYRGMLNEILQKTPELKGKSVDDIASMGIIAHSAGYHPAMAQLYKNGLQDKITSVTVLDSMYNSKAYDQWITNNLQDLAAGRKQFQLIYTGHLSKQSTGLETRVERQLSSAGLGTESVYKDHRRGGELVSPETMAQHGFVFKRSEFTNRGDGAHGAMTHVYLRQLLNSEKRRR